MQVFSKIHSPCLGEIEFIVALLGLENELIEAVAAHYYMLFNMKKNIQHATLAK